MCVGVLVCLYVVCVRERERERKRKKEKDANGERDIGEKGIHKSDTNEK
jgi:hypothetical protein